MSEATGNRFFDEQGVPKLAPGWESRVADLSPEEGFLLSRIDGHTSWALLRSIGGLPPERVDRCLADWVEDGLLRIEAAPDDPPRRAAGTAPRVDPRLQLPVEIQQQILDFEGKLDRPYHEILGVPHDADERAIKRAYFKLSRLFHPDRYFRREIGPFAARLDRIFKRIALAYELLSDPATRAEVERSLAAPPEPPPPRPGEAPRPLTKREWLARMRRQFKIPDKVLAERRFRARQLADAARVAQHQGSWNEAASCIRLAIAFDPWSDDYKDCFAAVMAEVNQLRAAKLLEEAGGAWDSSSMAEALRLYEEALAYRPTDAEIHDRAAQVAIELENYDQALEYAERACELAPESAAHHFTLGRCLRRLGRRESALEALEKARQLDPGDSRVREEISRLRPGPGRSIGGMR